MPEQTPTRQPNPLLAISADNAQFVTELDLLQDGTAGVNDLAMSGDGSRLAAAGEDGVVRLWNPRDGELLGTLVGQTAAVNSVAFSPDGTVLAAAGEDGMVRLWDVAAGRITLEISDVVGEGVSAPFFNVAFNPAGDQLAAGNGLPTGSVALWNAGSGELQARLTGHVGPVHAVRFSPDGAALAVAVGSAGRGAATVYLYDAAGRQVGQALGATEAAATATSLAFSPDGAMVAAGYDLGYVEMWQVAAGESVYRLEELGVAVRSVAFSPDGRTLAAGGADGTVGLWDAKSGDFLRTLEGHRGAVNGLAFRPDGYLLFSGAADGTIRVWGMPVP
jgi:WD40 repeat protein